MPSTTHNNKPEHGPLPIEKVFVLKLAESTTAGELTGRLEHVVSGRQFEFGSARQLMALLRQTGPDGRLKP
ncbi:MULTISPECIES: hypothetical protein [Roseateles]|uniref:Uncharacterized protein n=1 Tax=Roseateles albus TaxID=2987525 RepID=A0ABT5KDB4_9BURK|nr:MULTISPECIES: hypothetical protein [Roseateles]MCV2360380.1 hypothetical protein [Paucibacter sp. TC2R-5]MDC8771918.1 hypothetical protein [Roseateles albus]